MTIEYEKTSPRLIVTFLVLVGAYVLVWVYWERIPELAQAHVPYYDKTSALIVEGLRKVEGVREYVLNSNMSGYVWENRSMFAGGYALIALFLLVMPSYRNDPDRLILFCRTGCIVLGGLLLLISIIWLGTVLDGILKPRPASSYPIGIWPNVSAGAWIGRIVFGTLHALLMIAFMIVLFIGFYGGIYIGLPIAFLFLLFLLPGAVWDVLRFVVRAPFLLWHYLHYLIVPHPMEKAILKHEKMKMKRGVTIDHEAVAGEISRAQYDPERDGIPVWWKSANWARRLKNAAALRSRVKTERQVADEYTEELRKRNNQR